MKENRDPWYIRLPDGRVLKAKSTDAVRHHLEAGNIPRNSTARRDPSEEWVALSWVQEFTAGVGNRAEDPTETDVLVPQLAAIRGPDPNPRAGVSSRLDPMRLQTVGVRGFVEELLAALDSTVNRAKLWTGCLSGMVIALFLFLIPWLIVQVWADGAWLGSIIAWAAAGVALAFGVTIVTRQTHQELSTMRPVSWAEARTGMQPFFLRLSIAYLLVGGVGYGLIELFQRLPGWIFQAGLSGTTFEVVATAVSILGLLVAISVFVVLMFTLLVAPILVVEEGSVTDAIREWRALIREHRLRVFLYEGLAFAFGLVTMLPLAIPFYLALSHGPGIAPNMVGVSTIRAIGGLVAGPLIAFLAVANVFVYLNLRYEYSPPK